MASVEAKEKGSLILICGTQRSLTTIFIRVCMNHPKIKVFNDPFSGFYYGEKLFKKSERTLENWLEEFSSKIDNYINEGFTVIVKDMSFVYLVDFGSLIDDWIKKYNPKFLHMVRHPKARLSSFKLKLDYEFKTKQFEPEIYNYCLYQETYQNCLDMYNKYGGKVLISENLQHDPINVFKKSFEFFGLEFNESFLTYEPIKDIPEDLYVPFLENYHKVCFESTSFKTEVTDIDAIKLDPSFDDVLAISTSIYNKLKELPDQL